MGGGAGHAEEQMGTNEWETRFGWRVDIEAAVTYLGGPITGMSSPFRSFERIAKITLQR